MFNNISEYFTLNRTLSGAFGLLHRIWGMHVVESVRDKPPVWHPDVRHYRLFNGTELLGNFYFDPFERVSKIGVPFTQTLVKRSEVHGSLPGKDRTPIVIMSTCIKAPTPGGPALLQINDVQAVFHELGHVIQNLVNRENQALGATTTLPLDFLEVGCRLERVCAVALTTSLTSSTPLDHACRCLASFMRCGPQNSALDCRAKT